MFLSPHYTRLSQEINSMPEHTLVFADWPRTVPRCLALHGAIHGAGLAPAIRRDIRVGACRTRCLSVALRKVRDKNALSPGFHATL